MTRPLLFADASGKPIRRDLDVECHDFASLMLGWVRCDEWTTTRDVDLLAEDIQDLVELAIERIKQRNAERAAEPAVGTFGYRRRGFTGGKP